MTYKTPQIYLKIKDKLKEESTDNKIERRKVYIILGRCFHFPKELKNGVINGLEKNDLITIINKFEIQIN